MVIREAQRSFSYLTLYDHITDALVVNRLVPDSASGEFAASWRRMQQRYMREIHEMFDPQTNPANHATSVRTRVLTKLHYAAVHAYVMAWPVDLLAYVAIQWDPRYLGDDCAQDHEAEVRIGKARPYGIAQR